MLAVLISDVSKMKEGSGGAVVVRHSDRAREPELAFGVVRERRVSDPYATRDRLGE
jgi:hypothetical protein